jgi:RNA polymerase sigma-70 factor (ECF subfamily)
LSQIPDEIDPSQDQKYKHELIVWAAEQVRSQFRPSSWQAFWLTLVEGRPVGEVAQQLQVSPGSIYMSRSRIMTHIRAKIAEVLDE